ncbi:FeoA family protein [Carboxydothermus ferrireducens]|uniref:Ferrous iron transport protein A n=1 Tax=Carboxydothermus ferrireducens DSM 11255 TaxID=1119529 RepID=A0ABX2RCA5_9THEO|nr:FeoA family protein [Carboxydothermus ferrireducens]NYE58821.1 ferrous iron transport protein A [Carboxydothermus ferrireducens DSM 11255]
MEASAKPLAISLYSMRPGEKGIVAYFNTKDEAIIKKLMAMGVIPGLPIALEQRFPSFIIKVGRTRAAIDQDIAKTIYVRLTSGK